MKGKTENELGCRAIANKMGLQKKYQRTENTAVSIRHADHMAPSIRISWY
jgi:hypothetical protein